MTDRAGRSRLLRRIARAAAWAVTLQYVLGMGSKIWLDYQLGLETALFDVMLSVGFAAFAGVPDTLAVFGVWTNGIYFYPLLALALIYLPLVFPDGRLPSQR